MTVLTVRNLSDNTVTKLRVRAAQRGRSMEAEVRDVLVKVADGARLLAPTSRPSVDDRVAEVQAMVRAKLGALPQGRVDALIAGRRAEAERDQ